MATVTGGLMPITIEMPMVTSSLSYKKLSWELRDMNSGMTCKFGILLLLLVVVVGHVCVCECMCVLHVLASACTCMCACGGQM